MQIVDSWFDDIPQQFLGKKNIEVLIRTFARQLQELQQVFDDLDTRLDLDVATGQNLDYVGTIIPLSRKEAGELVNKRFQEPVISDYRYRQYLKYKMLQNTSECTYYDIMKAIEILWDVDKAYYYERADRPATIFIGLPAVGVDEDDQAKGKPSIMKPAGVGLFYTAQYSMAVDESSLEMVTFVCLDMHVFLHFFARILNGDWLLDGSVSLGQIPICEIAMEIVIGIIGVFHASRVRFPTLGLFAVIPMALRIIQRGMDVGYFFDSSEVFNSGVLARGNVEVNIPVRMDMEVNAESVTIEKDLWRLDGQVLLDGSRILDAEVWKERL